MIKTSLRTAYSLGYINDEADKIIRPRITERRIECFSLSEQRKIEQYIIKKNKPRMIGILICLYSGLRIGELLALEWGDIDFSKGELLVNKTCYEGKGKSGIYLRSVDSPKTQSSIRTVPLPKQIVVLLKEVKKSSKSKYVVSNGEKFISIRSYQRSFSIIQKNLGISHRGFHALRHTFATRALECGMDVKTLSEIMGHKSATVTLNRYAHSCAEYKKEFMNRLGNNLFQKGQLSSN